MASAILTRSYSSHTSSPSPTLSKNPTIYASRSTSQISYPKNPILRSLTSVPQLCLSSFSTWNGLRQNAVSISLKSLTFERRRKCKRKKVCASLFGVGAPEALVIGVVALLVFGPKGLAEIAKNLGNTLRAFQPTIRELQEVSREFKSTLEKEIGLDELQSQTHSNYASNVATLSSSPLVDSSPENSPATSPPPAAATEDFPETLTPLAATTEDFPATATPPASATEDSQVTATPPAEKIMTEI